MNLRVPFLYLAFVVLSFGASASDELAPGLMGEYYKIGQPLLDFPVITREQPCNLKRVDTVLKFSDGPDGFAGTPLQKHFYVRWSGEVRISNSGEYRFYLRSEGGARLFIDGRLVVENDDRRSSADKSAAIPLSEGDHRVKVDYFVNTQASSSLALLWKPPGKTKDFIPAAVLIHRKKDAEAGLGVWVDSKDTADSEAPKGNWMDVIFDLSTEPGDVFITGDWDGNGTWTPGIVRGTNWFLWNSNEGGPPDISFHYGQAGDAPVTGDWNGDRTFTPGVVRKKNGSLLWCLRNSNSSGDPDIQFVYGRATCKPVVGDWNGDRIWTVGVVSNKVWQLRKTNSSGAPDIQFGYGKPTDRFVVGDWDGDGVYTPGVFREGTWYLRNSNTSGNADLSFVFGQDSDIPASGDWYGVGTTTVGIVQAGRWRLRNCNQGMETKLVEPTGVEH